ncbi:hypothetical protein F5H01DRAFT_76845 [Linnemannia elongata]|nr:hypothetical protein F5H01DRAFT_76845 [Linnemannia elongata]
MLAIFRSASFSLPILPSLTINPSLSQVLLSSCNLVVSDTICHCNCLWPCFALNREKYAFWTFDYPGRPPTWQKYASSPASAKRQPKERMRGIESYRSTHHLHIPLRSLFFLFVFLCVTNAFVMSSFFSFLNFLFLTLALTSHCVPLREYIPVWMNN